LYRGFTGHEHLPQFGLINMNGRLYDPLVGRMLSPDNNVQMPDFTQNYNRYSYALNNPLRFTDPDGEWIHILIGAAIGAVVHTAAHLVTHKFTFRDWDWGAFAGSIVGGAVGGGVGSAFASAGVGGFWAGAATGAASGFSANLTTGLIHGDNFGKIIGNSFKGALIGGAIGGVIGGIDASIKGQRFWDGTGKVATERYLVGSGNTPEENYYYTNDRLSELGEVSSDATREWRPDINLGFEGDLQVRGMAYPQAGETFMIKSDGKILFSTTDRGVRINLKIPSSNKNITWGIYGDRVKSQISNNLTNSTSGTLNEIVVTASKFNSYIRIWGSHRSWNGFLFWR
jgi:RHS repeat-associated protein